VGGADCQSLEIVNYLLFLREPAAPTLGPPLKLNALAVLSSMSSSASEALRWRASARDNVFTWGMLILTIVTSSLTNLTNTGMEVSLERDWSVSGEPHHLHSELMSRVIAIAQGNGANLTRLNTAMRMISMISRVFPSVGHGPLGDSGNMRTQKEDLMIPERAGTREELNQSD
jgi:hypothetical protein